MASKEPPLAASAFGDIASWFVQSAARLRRAKQQFETNLKIVGDKLPGSTMAAAEASELNHLQYMASIALDVDLYAKAIEKLEEEKETAEKQWKPVEGESHQGCQAFPGCHATERVCLLAAFGACGIENKKGVGSSSGGGGHVPSSTIENQHWMQRQ